MGKKNYLVILAALLFFLQGQFIFPQDSGKRVSIPKSETATETEHYNYPANKSSGEGDVVFSKKSFDKDTYNYFRIDKTGQSLWNGKHWKPADYPLKVYVRSCDSKYFKSLYKSYVDYALGVWEQADSRIKFRYVSNEFDAHVVVVFEENLITKYDDNYLGITDYDLSSEKKINKSIVEIGLLKFNNELVSDGEVKATVIHEMGHALGLGHSENEADIMFPFINPFSSSDMEYDELSGGDVRAIRSVVDLGYKFTLN